MLRLLPVALVVPILIVGACSSALGAATVELEVYLEERAPLTAPQEWLARLGQAGVANVQIRAKQAADVVGMERTGTVSRPVYRVVGALNSNNELVLPGARFRLSEAARVAEWLNDLARLGPASERPAKVMFGLSGQQLDQARAELSPAVGSSTAGMTLAAVVERIGGKVASPLELSPRQREALEEEKVAEELGGLSYGTVLAAALRPAGLCLVPRAVEEGKLRFEIVRSKPDLEVWPVGWPLDRPERELAPVMYEFLNVNVQGVAITEVLKAVGGRLKMPVLMDRNAMARHGVEPEKTIIKLPQSRTTYSILLRKALFQARLKHEVRMDEGGRPFLWITTLKPI